MHNKKADVFYQRKCIARVKGRINELVEAVCFDYQKNLPVPKISTNDVYYRRQLSVYTFKIQGKVYFTHTLKRLETRVVMVYAL